MMKQLKSAAITAMLTMPALAIAGTETAKDQEAFECPQGYGMSYSLVCDQNQRGLPDLIWPTRKPGVAICRAQFQGCAPVWGRSGGERPGLTVRDAAAGGEMVVVSFGMERLLGEFPAAK